jgi:hypothetical protein
MQILKASLNVNLDFDKICIFLRFQTVVPIVPDKGKNRCPSQRRGNQNIQEISAPGSLKRFQ